MGRFISADTVVPGAGNPQALNRYSYSYNNPLKYTDPSGHCPNGDGGAECRWLERIARETFGVTFSSNFGENEIAQMMSYFGDIASKIGGSDVFFSIWHGTSVDLWETGDFIVKSGACTNPRSCQNKTTVHMLRAEMSLGNVAHEFAHVWDYLTRPQGLANTMDSNHGGLWQEMAEKTGSHWAMTCVDPKFCEYGQYTNWVLGPNSPGDTRSYARSSAYEDWAMSFQLWVTGDPTDIFNTYARTSFYDWQIRSDFVQQKVDQRSRYINR